MSLPVLPTYSVADAINAVGVFAPVLQGKTVPLGTMLHAGIIIVSYANENFIIDPSGSAQAQKQISAAGGLRWSTNPPQAYANAQTVSAGNATGFNWIQLLIDVVNAIIKALGGLTTAPGSSPP